MKPMERPGEGEQPPQQQPWGRLLRLGAEEGEPHVLLRKREWTIGRRRGAGRGAGMGDVGRTGGEPGTGPGTGAGTADPGWGRATGSECWGTGAEPGPEGGGWARPGPLGCGRLLGAARSAARFFRWTGPSCNSCRLFTY